MLVGVHYVVSSNSHCNVSNTSHLCCSFIIRLFRPSHAQRETFCVYFLLAEMGGSDDSGTRKWRLDILLFLINSNKVYGSDEPHRMRLSVKQWFIQKLVSMGGASCPPAPLPLPSSCPHIQFRNCRVPLKRKQHNDTADKTVNYRIM